MIAVVLLLAVLSVALAVIGPKVLGRATDILFEGVISGQLPAGVTQDQAVAGLRAKGQDQVADMLSAMTLHPGEGVDFEAMGLTLLLVVAIYLVSAAFSWLQQWLMAGVAQRSMFKLRQAVDEKLARLPLKYFDDHPRGDVLSRMTNDIDNISQTLQQSLTQLITSALTIVGVLVMMLWISWLLALISVLVVPVSMFAALFIAKRSQKQFGAQWERPATSTAGRGGLHRPQRGQGLRPPGRGHRGLRRAERPALRVELQGAVHLGHDPAGDELHRQPQLRGGRRGRRHHGGQRAHLARRRAGLHPVLAAVHDADRADGQHHERAAVRRRVGRARLRAARRGRGGAGLAAPVRARSTRAATSPCATCRSAISPTRH